MTGLEIYDLSIIIIFPCVLAYLLYTGMKEFDKEEQVKTGRTKEWIEGYTYGKVMDNPYDFYDEYTKHYDWCLGWQARKNKK